MFMNVAAVMSIAKTMTAAMVMPSISVATVIVPWAAAT